MRVMVIAEGKFRQFFQWLKENKKRQDYEEKKEDMGVFLRDFHIFCLQN